MIKLYVKELSLNYHAKHLYQYLRTKGINLELTDNLDSQSDIFYIILGAQYLTQVPKNYCVYQLLPTSSLTLKSGIEAYWYDEKYIEILKGAKFIIDSSKININVFNQYYKISNTLYYDCGFESSLIVDSTKRDSYYTPSDRVFIIKNFRSENIYDKYKDDNKLTIELIDNNDLKDIVDKIREKKGLCVLINPYKATNTDIILVLFLRYNHIPCIVEKGTDLELNDKISELGCQLVNYIHLEKNFHKVLNNSFEYKIVKNRKGSELDIEKFKSFFQSNNENKKKSKPKKLKLYDRKSIESIDFEIFPDGGISLKLGEISDDDLPKISICTPTYNRRWIFPLAVRNFFNFIYPKEKVEWVILDDGEKSIEEVVPRDARVKYHYQKEKSDISSKRNKLVELASNDVIVFMDDDDFYPPESLIARVKALIKYGKKGVGCVGCIDVATFDIRVNKCSVCSNGISYLTESSLAFTREFWKERSFRGGESASEYRYFMEYRQDNMRSLPFQFVTIALSHHKNTTGELRAITDGVKEEERAKIVQMFDDEFIDFMDSIKKLM